MLQISYKFAARGLSMGDRFWPEVRKLPVQKSGCQGFGSGNTLGQIGGHACTTPDVWQCAVMGSSRTH